MVFNFVKCYFNNFMATLIPLYNRYLVNEVTVVFLSCWDQLHHKSSLVCGRGMRCDDCTQHVLDGSLNVCTLVESCCAHCVVVYASAWVAGHLGRATQTNAILLQNGFSHFFNVVTCHPHKWTSVLCVCPQQRTSPLQSWSVCSWDQCECLIENAILWSDHKYNHIHTSALYLLTFNSVSPFICSGTPLRLEI